MIGAIAIMAGFDPKDDKVKALVFACLAGNAMVAEAMKHVGVEVGKKLTQAAIERISVEVLKKINQAVGFRLVSKFGQTSAVSLGKSVPIIGGLVGGTFDGVSTSLVGKVAKKVFLK